MMSNFLAYFWTYLPTPVRCCPNINFQSYYMVSDFGKSTYLPKNGTSFMDVPLYISYFFCNFFENFFKEFFWIFFSKIFVVIIIHCCHHHHPLLLSLSSFVIIKTILNIEYFFSFFLEIAVLSCISSSCVYATRKLQKLQSPVGDCNFEAFLHSEPKLHNQFWI